MTCHHIKFGGRARAILTVADDYKPGDQPPQDPSDYLGWHEWADVQHKAKLRQKQCGRCCLWRYPQELSRQIDRRQLSDSRGAQGRYGISSLQQMREPALAYRRTRRWAISVSKMKTPIEMMLDGVQWTAQAPPDDKNGLYATHAGVFSIAGYDLRCYRLNNGQAVFNADDFERFFNGLDGE